MTPKTIFLVIITALLSLNAVAQYGETIRSGRPGQAIGPFAVGKNVFQVQAGNDWSKLEDKRTQLTGTANSTDGVFRYGLTEHFEISSAISFLQENFEQNNTKSSNKGINSFGIRMRSNVYVGKELVPTIGFQFNLNLPIVNEIYQADYIAPKIMMMTGQSFNNFSFVSNWAIRRDMLTKPDRLAGEARLRYLDADIEVLAPGDYVLCAVTAEQISLEELRYWSVDLQEPYATAEIATRKFMADA